MLRRIKCYKKLEGNKEKVTKVSLGFFSSVFSQVDVCALVHAHIAKQHFLPQKVRAFFPQHFDHNHRNSAKDKTLKSENSCGNVWICPFMVQHTAFLRSACTFALNWC